MMKSSVTDLEKFGFKVYATLAENFSQTFFVGGMVRDWLLSKPTTDIDLATEASPEQVISVLKKLYVTSAIQFLKFGIIIARQGSLKVEIATFRQDLKAANRYPKVRLVNSPKVDSQRRDFTINALYFNPLKNDLLDFHLGLGDLQKRQIKFIGDPNQRITEDPLRIIRALRFQLQLNFSLEKKTAAAIKNNFNFIKKLSHNKISAEISKLPTKKQQKQLWTIIHKTLDAH